MALTRETFRLELVPCAAALRDHPVWASYTEPSDGEAITGWGIDRAWLHDTLASFEGFRDGYTHPMFPVLDLARVDEFSNVVFAADLQLANGRVALGFLCETHAFGIFVPTGSVVFNKNLPEMARESVAELEAEMGRPAFPMLFRAHCPDAPAGAKGSIEPWW